MDLAALDPFANAASKAPRTLGCLPLKPEQTQVICWSVGRDVLAVLATGFVLRSPTSCVRLRQSWPSSISRAGFIDPHATIKDLAGAYRSADCAVLDVK